MSMRIVFTGDISFSKYFENAWQSGDVFSPEIRQYLQKADHVVANVECPLTNHKIRSDRVLNHASSPEVGKLLKEANIRYWSLANNHIMDCETEGLRDTLKCAKENSCFTVGAGENISEASRPLIIGDSIKIGILSISKPWSYLIADDNAPGALTWNKKEYIKECIHELQKKVDWIILVVHGGDEYSDIALPYMRKQYKELLGFGADIIVAHHPHVVQNYELLDNKAIFYSLGNFVFDTENQRCFKHTDVGVLLGIEFEKKNFHFDHLPIHINRKHHKVEAGKTPAVFCNINEQEYKALWPLEARMFYHVDFKKRKKLSKKMASYPKLIVAAHEVYICRHKRERMIQIGRLLSCFGKWKRSKNHALIEYIKE